MSYPRAVKPENARFTWLHVILIGIVFLPIAWAFFFPGIGHSKSSAKKASCLSNAKQILLAAQAYAADHDDKVPLLSTPFPKQAIAYKELLKPYGRNANYDTFVCPADNADKPFPVNGKSHYEAFGSSYRFHPMRFQLESFGRANGADTAIFVYEAEAFHPFEPRKRNAGFYDGHAKFMEEKVIFDNLRAH